MLRKESRILIVDDSATTRKIVKKYLNDVGYTFLDEAPDGNAAWEKINGAHPSYKLIITDWHMPKLQGIELLEKIRNQKATSKLNVILVTAERNADEVKRALALQVTNYLVKPFEPEMLIKSLEKIEDYPEDVFGNKGDVDFHLFEQQRLEKGAKKG